MADPAHEHVEPTYAETTGLSTVRRTRPGYAGLALRIALTLLGAAALVVSAFATWIQGELGVDLTVRSLWMTRFNTSATFVATVGFVAIVLGLLAIVGLAPRTGTLTRLVGALSIAMFVLFLIQVYRADRTLSDLNWAPWLVLAGGVVALIGGFLGTRETA